jgi:hypothetical protein
MMFVRSPQCREAVAHGGYGVEREDKVVQQVGHQVIVQYMLQQTVDLEHF